MQALLTALGSLLGCGGWRLIVGSAFFQPDLIPEDVLSRILRELTARGPEVGFYPAQDAAALRIILDWAVRGGWGAEQHASLRQLTVEFGCLVAVSTRQLFSLQAHYPASLLDAAVSMTAVLQNSATAQCLHCSKVILLSKEDEESCTRTYHPGSYSLYKPGRKVGRGSGGWSCCREPCKCTVGCRKVTKRHTDPPVS